MRKEQTDVLDRLPSTGKPFNNQNIQNVVNTTPTDVLQAIAEALGGGLIYDVVTKIWTLTPTQKQKLQQVQSNPTLLSQVVGMMGGAGMLNQGVTNALSWILKQVGL